MILPAGKAKKLKEQSLSAQVQNSVADSLLGKLSNDVIRKIALTLPTDKTEPAKANPSGGSYSSPELQDTLNDSNSATMRAPGEDEQSMGTGNTAPMPNQNPQQGNPNPNGWKFDPHTGEPVNAIDGAKLVQSGNEWLATIDPNLAITGFTQKGPNYTLTIGPRAGQGKMVSKP